MLQEPFRSAFADTWRATTLEAVFAHYVAGPALAANIAQQETTRFPPTIAT